MMEALSNCEMGHFWLALRETDRELAEDYRQELLERLDGTVDFALAGLILDHHPWANAPEVALATEVLSEEFNLDPSDLEWCLAVAREIRIMGGVFMLSTRWCALTFAVHLAATILPRPPELADVAEVYRHAISRDIGGVAPHLRATGLIQAALADV